MSFKISTKYIFTLLCTVVSFVSITQPIFAQESSVEQRYPQPAAQSTICGIADGKQATVVTNGQCSDEYLTGICGSMINFTSEALFGYTWNNGACTVKVEGVAGLIKLQQQSKRGILAGVHQAQAFLLDQRPISAKEFFEEKIYAIQNIGKVSAQEENPNLYLPGTGFALLQPIQSFWGWSVNIVYGLLIFIIIGVALSIVFRSSLNGQAIVTIQNAIPNIALAMILVPLSYAISGLFIDAVTIGTNVVHQFLIGPGAPGHDVYLTRNENLGDRREGTEAYEAGYYDRGLFPDDDRVNWLNARDGLEIETEVNGFVNFVNNVASDNGWSLVNGIASIFGYSNDRNGWIGSVVNFVVSIILLLTGLRIFWKLLQKWVVIIIGPIFAPFVFATVAIPGNGTKAIMNYVKFLGSFSATYIVAYAMLLLSMVLSSRAFQASIPDFGSSGYIPPLMGIEQFLGSGGGALPTIDTNLTGFYLALASLVVYLLIPKTLDNISKQLGAEGFALGALVGDAITSAKDSINLGKRGVNLAANAPVNINKARTKAFQSTMNALDRARGVRPGEDGSYLARRRGRLASRLGELEQKRTAAVENGNWAAARYYQTRINQLNRTIGDTDEASGGDGKKTEGPNDIQLKLAWNGVEGALDIATVFQQLEQAANNPMNPTNNNQIRGGSITITSKHRFYPDINLDRTKIGDRTIGFNTSLTHIPLTDIIFKGYKFAAAPPLAALPDASVIDPTTMPLFSKPGSFAIFIDGGAGAEIQPDGKSAKLSLYFTTTNAEQFITDVLESRTYKSTYPEEMRITLPGRVFGQRDMAQFGENVGAQIGGVNTRVGVLRSSRGLDSNKIGFGVRSSVTNVINRSSRKADPLAQPGFNANNR